jgi:hemerythrin-like metal-binding protein
MTLNHQGPEYRLGVREIDTQHTTLIRLMNELHEAMAAGAGKEVMGRIVRRVVADTEVHFKAEEHLMLQHGFPGRGNHHIEHLTLMRQTKQLRSRVRAGDLDVAVEIHDLLSKWLDRHILSADRKLAVFLNGKGVT